MTLLYMYVLKRVSDNCLTKNEAKKSRREVDVVRYEINLRFHL